MNDSNQLILLRLLLFIILFIQLVIAQPQKLPLPTNLFHQVCKLDLDHYCGPSNPVWEIYCLHNHWNNLTSSCKAYIGNSTIGGCNNDAQLYCSEYISVQDITSCLLNHTSVLSSSCLDNLTHQNASQSNPILEQLTKLRRVTSAVTVIGLVWILLGILIILWMIRQLHLLYTEQLNVLGFRSSHWKKQGKIPRLVKLTDVSAGEEQNKTWTIEFYNLCYWAAPDNVMLGSNQSSRLKKQVRVLNEICGKCEACKVTAVMGPSGSGKTTLLRLLGGQMFSGGMCGVRAINGKSYTRRAYDEILRSQGFVPQVDNLLINLTVWQTLLFAAMLRLPQHMSNERKLCRAAFLMNDLGLHPIAHQTIGTVSGQSIGGTSKANKGISGGQRRLLSIALELISNPGVLFLDEPTSGLDASNTLKIVKILHRMTREYRTTVVLTIHQPRAEVFMKFDSLLLLNTGGQLAYYGSGAQAATILAAASTGLQRRLEQYSNPGDFLIDLLGLNDSDNSSANYGTTNNESMQLLLSEDGEETGDRSEANTPTSQTTSSMVNLHEYFRSTQVYHDLVENRFNLHPANESFILRSTRLTQTMLSVLTDWMTWIKHSIVSIRWLLPSARRTSAVENRHMSTGRVSADSSPTGRLADVELVPLRGSGCNDTPSDQMDNSLEARPCPQPFSAQMWILFGRRILAFLPTSYDILAFTTQIVVVSVIISVTFSFKVSTELELPYQVVLLLSFISLYVMILQYLVLVPEYMVERGVILAESTASYISPWAYIISAALLELPRAIIQSLLILTVSLSIHSLNPDVVYQRFTFVCLIIGVHAWQSLLAICSVATDLISVAYSSSFLLLGSGTLFGGLLVRLNKLPRLFRIMYYISITAVTQRALIANDLQCCYLSTTCNSIAKDLHINPQFFHPYTYSLPVMVVNVTGNQSTAMANYVKNNSSSLPTIVMSSFCPPGLEFSGDGSDEGNLGRLFIYVLDLQHDRPFLSLIALILASLFCRVIAALVLQHRLYTKDRLVELDDS